MSIEATESCKSTSIFFAKKSIRDWGITKWRDRGGGDREINTEEGGRQ